MFQMFKRYAKNNCNEISDAEANIVASRELKFWLRRIACAMVKTKIKSICMMNKTNKLIGNPRRTHVCFKCYISFCEYYAKMYTICMVLQILCT